MEGDIKNIFSSLSKIKIAQDITIHFILDDIKRPIKI